MTPAWKQPASCVFLIKEVRESRRPSACCQELWFATASDSKVDGIYRKTNDAGQWSKEGERARRNGGRTRDQEPSRTTLFVGRPTPASSYRTAPHYRPAQGTKGAHIRAFSRQRRHLATHSPVSREQRNACLKIEPSRSTGSFSHTDTSASDASLDLKSKTVL